MTTGKHSDLQTLQNSDGTFELVVSSEPLDEWSDVEDVHDVQAASTTRSLPWKLIIVGVLAVLVVAFVGKKIMGSVSGGVSVATEPLPVVTGFRPYLGGAAASLGSGRAVRPRPSKRSAPVEDDWVDPETEERELEVEQGEPVAQIDQIEPPNEEVEDEIQMGDDVEEPVNNMIHGIEPSALPRIPAAQGLQRNLNSQLRALSNNGVDLPIHRPDIKANLAKLNESPTDDLESEEEEVEVEEDLAVEEREEESEE